MSGISLMMLGPFISGGAIAGAWDLTNIYYNPRDLRYFPDGRSDAGPLGSTAYSNISGTAQRPVGGTFIHPDGDIVYYTSSGYYTGSAGTHQKSLSTAWDISTISSSVTASISEGYNRGIWFNGDGTYMLLTSFTDVWSYELTTPWSLSSITVENKTGLDTTNHGRAIWNDDGTQVFRCVVTNVEGTDRVTIITHDLSTAYDLSTATLNNTFYDTEITATAPADNFVGPTIDFYFNATGTLLTVIGNGYATYSLVTPWDLSGSLSLVRSHTTTTIGENRNFVEGGATNLNYLYTNVSGTAAASTVLYALSIGWLPSDIASPNLTGINFKPDGTKVYISDVVLDDVLAYDLSTAWDLTTANSSAAESITTGYTNPKAIFFRPNGLELYVLQDNRNVMKSTLSTAWDISSASTPTSVFNSLTTIGTDVEGMFISEDGTMAFFVKETTSTVVYRVDLGTAWDFSTASLNASTLDVTGQGTTGGQVWLKPDGTEIYVLLRSNGTINQYTLSTPWDLSSATFYDSFDLTDYAATAASTYPSFCIDSTGSRSFVLARTGVYPFTIAER